MAVAVHITSTYQITVQKYHDDIDIDKIFHDIEYCTVYRYLN